MQESSKLRQCQEIREYKYKSDRANLENSELVTQRNKEIRECKCKSDRGNLKSSELVKQRNSKSGTANSDSAI